MVMTLPNRGGRKRRVPSSATKPIIGAQVEPSEQQAFDEIVNLLGRSRSYVLRVAVLRLIAQHKNGEIDWSGDIQKATGAAAPPPADPQ